MALKILHIAPFNTSGVPITFVRAERRLGHVSRLVTFVRDRRNYQEDICLNLPLLDFWGARLAKRMVSHPSKLAVDNQKPDPRRLPIEWHANGYAEDALVRFREALWQSRISKMFEKIDFWNFDVYQLDGGLEFFRDGRVIARLKDLGKKIICCYTGSDLRTRGVIPAIDALSDLNVTLELDHLDLHPDIHHVFFPFEPSRFSPAVQTADIPIRIGHAPTNRHAKGSERIIAAIKRLKARFPIELVLMENLSHEQTLSRKSSCHIFVDQIGDLGYGLNSLESLAMGIPTCSCLARGFEQNYSDHPFFVVDENNIEGRLSELIEDHDLRMSHARRGIEWVRNHHESTVVVKNIHKLAELN